MSNRLTVLQWAAISLAVAGAVCAGLFAMARQERVSAQAEAADPGQRVLTVFDGRDEQTFVTSATTVEDALKRRDIILSQYDATEPARDAQLVASSYTINIYRARPVLVVDGATRLIVMSASKSADAIVKNAGVKLYAEDETDIDRVDDILTDGMAAQKVTIDRSTPLQLELYGKRQEVRTQAVTVGQFMSERDIALGPADGVSPTADTPITAGMKLQIWRDGKQTVTQDVAIPFPVEKIQDMDQPVGYRQVTTPGKDGKRSVTYEIEMRNGREISRKEIQSVVITEPSKQVERVGAKLPTPTNPSENAQLGRQLMLAAGFGDDQWPCLYRLWMEESGWRVNADNPYSDAYGIPQALPGTKMGPGWQNDARVQINWGLGYIRDRYSTPCSAYQAKQAKGWY